MIENNDRHEFPHGTVSPSDFPLGSYESRVAARGIVQNINGAPDIEVRFIKPVIVDGKVCPPDMRERDSRRATCGKREWTREDGESLKAFKRRVRDDFPVGGVRGLLIFWPNSS